MNTIPYYTIPYLSLRGKVRYLVAIRPREYEPPGSSRGSSLPRIDSVV